MPKKKFEVPSLRIRLDGYERQPISDPRVQLAVDWVNEKKKEREAFPMAWALLIAALNGELGGQVQSLVERGAANTEEAMDALHDLLGAFRGEAGE